MSPATGRRMPDTVTIRRLDAASAVSSVPELSELLIACVEGGASVSFMLPVTHEKASRFWNTVADDVVNGRRAVLVAEDSGGRLLGTVQLVLALPENQLHRAELAKMLVHPHARRRGVARRLMAAIESTARDEGRTLLVLDTVTGSAAEALYARAGWQRVGEIPGYALMPDGPPCSTTIYYKALSR